MRGEPLQLGGIANDADSRHTIRVKRQDHHTIQLSMQRDQKSWLTVDVGLSQVPGLRIGIVGSHGLVPQTD